MFGKCVALLIARQPIVSEFIHLHGIPALLKQRQEKTTLKTRVLAELVLAVLVGVDPTQTEKIGRPIALLSILDLIKDSDARIRQYTAYALSKLAGHPAYQLAMQQMQAGVWLATLMLDENAKTQALAEQAINQLSPNNKAVLRGGLKMGVIASPLTKSTTKKGREMPSLSQIK